MSVSSYYSGIATTGTTWRDCLLINFSHYISLYITFHDLVKLTSSYSTLAVREPAAIYCALEQEVDPCWFSRAHLGHCSKHTEKQTLRKQNSLFLYNLMYDLTTRKKALFFENAPKEYWVLRRVPILLVTLVATIAFNFSSLAIGIDQQSVIGIIMILSFKITQRVGNDTGEGIVH